MTKRQVPSWQKHRKRGHRRVRAAKRPHVETPRAPHMRLLLWSVNGEPVTSFACAVDHGHAIVTHVDFHGIRYELVGAPDRRNGVAHYQTKTVLPKAVA